MRRPIVMLFGCALLGSVVACGAQHAEPAERVADHSLALAQAATISAQTKADATVAAHQPPAEQVITISAVGDCALGDLRRGGGAPGSFAHELEHVADPMAYPFSNVAKIFAEDDLTIANLEGTLTTHDRWTNEVFSVRGKPEYAAMLVRAGIELVDVDNNHSHDYGEIGHEDTKKALAAANVGHFGRGTIDRRSIKGMEIVNLGYLGGPSETFKIAPRDVRRVKQPGTIVIVSFHWGVEGFYATHPDQRKLAKKVIDAGADLVLGHHPHVLQGMESYKGKHIVYSLGNFVFGANSQPQDTDSIIYQEHFTVRDRTIVKTERTLIPVAISGRPERNDFRPVLLEGEARARVLTKIDKLNRKLGG